MEFDSVCGTGLTLGLSLNSSPSMVNLNTMDSTKQPSFEPSLTLGLSRSHGDQNGRVATKVGDIRMLYRQDSAVISGGGSSFSNKSSKREREVGSEESERVSNDNNYSRVMSATSVDDGEDDDDCANGRKKLRLTKPQSALLEQAFKHHSSLNPKQKQELARELKLRPRQVEVWFQNRRARTKLKQTEMNFEHLKKCCEKLTDENRRLQKELQELKALKSSQPFYMQLPAATLTMCPSCERIGDTKSALVKNPFTMGAKPHFFNSFTNPSTAC
ncbi:putative transcription factor homeobox-WOX family [Helianthus annuus]|uniref:Putative homeobox-leucine zipper protein family n=2 Tax=Helianthus annuus TaxID=4232 RepID=A0A251S7B5_HELAN|nr:homeobox-leucine zipper protein HAT22 isoform X2 [Helianthus annuus]KAF5763613.1 putative transcription factor HB-HD-ZIP family [Helianthus annuus]KAJ0450409.1 putative transcription factor homeobox-WOX family [Helianthus annuus]KAJ0454534.1 putative transcription factor homeobox-WOX family [Helianthus annuus]KAJ0472242.1 putative transcription factor homeobox-WOX family [Helianthus annuus]KAJ0647840.1 putative transcription factor homeobox-WOX family [Helianthus annuus]